MHNYIKQGGALLGILITTFVVVRVGMAWTNPTLNPPLGSGSGFSAAPAGSVMAFAGSAAPAGWMNADGSAVSRATYSSLFAIIGTTFGAGDGATTFNLPDLRGEFIRGLDSGRGVDVGRTIGTAQGDAIRNITGTLVRVGSQPGYTGPAGTGVFTRTANYNAGGSGGGGIAGNTSDFSFSAATVVPTATENRPRNIAMNYIIKY